MTITLRVWQVVVLWLLTLFVAVLGAQATRIVSSGTLPSNCTIGNLYIKTGTGVGFYTCLATNTWTGPYPSTGGGGTVYGRIGVVFDGGGEDVPTGPSSVNRFPQSNVTIIRVTLAADVSCSAAIDVWATTWSSSAYPANGNSITGGNEPELTSDLAFEDSTLTSWDTTMNAGDAVIVNVDSNTGCGHLTVLIDYSYSL